MSACSSSRATSVRSIPVGYSGFVPGLLSGNFHGAPWKDILNVIQTTPRNNVSNHLTPRNNIPKVGKENKLTKMLQNLKGETLRSVCQDLGLPPNGEKDILASRIISHATVDQDVHLDRPHSFSSDTSSQDTILNEHQPAHHQPSYAAPSRSAAHFVPHLGGAFVPQLSLGNRRPISAPRVYPVGYAGHVPGLVAGNLHGAPWRDLLTPRAAAAAAAADSADATTPREAAIASPRRLPASPRPFTPRGPPPAPGSARRSTPRPSSTASRRLSVDLYCC